MAGDSTTEEDTTAICSLPQRKPKKSKGPIITSNILLQEATGTPLEAENETDVHEQSTPMELKWEDSEVQGEKRKIPQTGPEELILIIGRTCGKRRVGKEDPDQPEKE